MAKWCNGYWVHSQRTKHQSHLQALKLPLSPYYHMICYVVERLSYKKKRNRNQHELPKLCTLHADGCVVLTSEDSGHSHSGYPRRALMGFKLYFLQSFLPLLNVLAIKFIMWSNINYDYIVNIKCNTTLLAVKWQLTRVWFKHLIPLCDACTWKWNFIWKRFRIDDNEHYELESRPTWILLLLSAPYCVVYHVYYPTEA